MTTAKSPLSVDYPQTNATAPLLPHLPLLTSHASGWHGVQLAYHRQPAWELPELSGIQRIIGIPAARHSVGVEFATEGRFQPFQYHPNDYLNGCIEVFPAGLPYKLCWRQEVEFIHCYLEPSFLSHTTHKTIDPDRVELLLELRRVDLLIHQILQLLKVELEGGRENDRVYIESLSTTLAAHLLRHYASREYKIHRSEKGLSKHQLKQAIEYINDHLGDNISLAAIATHLGMSQYYFCQLFKQSTEMTVHQYLTQQRVERAKHLLRQRKQTITAIALE